MNKIKIGDFVKFRHTDSRFDNPVTGKLMSQEDDGTLVFMVGNAYVPAEADDVLRVVEPRLFFITYGNNLIGCFSKIEAENYKEAREIAFAFTHGKFAFIYEGQEELDRQIELFNLREINLRPMEV